MARAKSTGVVRAAKKALQVVSKAASGPRKGSNGKSAQRSAVVKSGATAGREISKPRAVTTQARSNAATKRATESARKGARVTAKPDSSAAKRKLTPARKGAASGTGAARTSRKGGARVDTSAIAERLAHAITEPTCELRFRTPFELLIATILSAQSTDKMVNSVMPKLLARYPTAHELARAREEELEPVIKSTGFFRNKAKSIRGAAERLVAQHGGEVPRTIEEMIALPGVARKTANVVLGTAYGVASGFVVDTHVARVSQRLALTVESDPVRIEQDLCARFPTESWVAMGHRLVLHGRYTCTARAPMCTQCPLNELCASRLDAAEAAVDERAREEAARVARGFAASLPA